MNILFYIYRYHPKIGGVEKYIHELARALITKDHRITVVTGSHDNTLPQTETHESVTIHRFPALRSPVRCRLHHLRLRHLFKSADIIHISDIMMLEQYRRMIGWTLPHKKIFLTRHGLSIQHPVPNRDKTRAARATKYATATIDDGHFISKWLESPATTVIPQGLSPAADQLQYIKPPDSPGATFIGRLEWDTGIDDYISAIGILKKRHNITVPLNVVGDGSLRQSLESRAKTENLPVRFQGQRTNAQDQLLNQPYALVSGRLAIHEALARRRPVIAHHVNPIKHDYLANEPFSPYIRIAATPDDIANELVNMINNPDETQTRVKKGYEYTRQLTWDRTANEYLNIWKNHSIAQELPINIAPAIG